MKYIHLKYVFYVVKKIEQIFIFVMFVIFIKNNIILINKLTWMKKLIC